MSSRREFLGSVGRASVGAALCGGALEALAQSRRTVSVAGKQITVVDVHAHCVFPGVERIVPDVIPGGPIGELLTLGPRRLAEMDARGIDVQALSVNQFWWYSLPRDRAAEVVRIHDQGLAEWCAEHSERFVGLSSVALQFPDLAIEQLDHAVNDLGLRGASVGGHVNGEVPTSAKYDPFWAHVEALDVPVFMHPNNALNVVRDDALAGRGNLDNIIGNPLETTLFLTRMIFDGVLDRFPRLKICGAHGGGYLPSYLGRTEVACEVRSDADCANRRPPSEYLREQVFVDSMVFSAEGLRHLVAETGASQVVYGSDIPYVWPDTIDLIVDSPHLAAADKEAVLGGNLLRLLKVSS
jgi:aminocarboxymuconate-semialdehyde decarboxylase